MPSFLGRLFGLSFRTELLIMNLVGLVNSTLDWSPLKWTNKLERIWNLSLSQRALILDTIGEDTIKTVLSWIVITRIVIAHVYTFTYLTNIYPIITWSRPNLLLPWLILSFFKNVVLEVIVIVIGLLIWYETRFSVVIFLEFIFVKLVPLILACYNWYSNSCLFLQLRYIEKLRTLRRSMRSDSNLISSRLYVKIEDSKYRTRSLTTLLSCESYETYDTQDTISRILDDPNLTSAQKTIRILGLTEKDIEEARIRIRKREMTKKLTKEVDEISMEIRRKDLNSYYLAERKYELDSILKTKDQSPDDDSDSKNTVVSSTKNDSPVGESKKISQKESEGKEENVPQNLDPNISRQLSKKKREGSQLEAKRTKQMKLCPSCHVNDVKQCNQFLKRRELARLNSTRQNRRSMEKSCSPIKLQAFFNCDCLLPAYSEEKLQNCCTLDKTIFETFMSNKNLRDKENAEGVEEEQEDAEECSQRFLNTVNRLCLYACSVTNVETDMSMNSNLSLMDRLLNNDLEMLPCVKRDDQGVQKSVLLEDKSIQDIEALEPRGSEANAYFGMATVPPNALVDVQELSSVVEDLTVTTSVIMSVDTLEMSRRQNDVAVNVESELLRTVVASKISADDSMSSKYGASSAQKSNLQLYTPLDTEKNVLKLNFPEYSFGNTNIPKFYKDSMKVFDGCYEKDFENNSELQCLLQQMEKKKWNLFAGQTNLEMLFAIQKEDQIIKQLQKLGTNDSVRIKRFEAQPELFPRPCPKPENLVSQTVQADKQPHEDISQKLENAKFVSSLPLVKEISTQVDGNLPPTMSFNSIAIARKRRKQRYLREQKKEQALSVSKPPKAESTTKSESSSLSKDHSKSDLGFWHRPSSEDIKKQPSIAKSLSDKSVCECKMQQLEAKYSASSELKLEKKYENWRSAKKPAIENFGTFSLAQVARSSNVETIVSRKKPPVYPKESKKQNSGQPSAKKTLAKQHELMEPKRLTNRQTLYGSKELRSKNRVKSLEEQEALEMKALKAYNEDTLMKDKKELEARKKLPAGRNFVDQVTEKSKRYAQTKGKGLDRIKKNIVQTFNEKYLNKENVFVDAMTETDSLVATSLKDSKVNASDARSFNVSKPCTKLLTVNKVTEKLLDNFDRLRGSQLRQDLRKSKVTAEVDTRKQYTKYSKSRNLTDEKNLSESSSKKLEGTQKGRELERTPANEDIRKRIVRADKFSNVDQLPSSKLRRDSKSLEVIDKEVLMTIKSTVDQVVSSWSSSTVDQGDEVLGTLDGNPNTEDLTQTPLKVTELKNQEIEDPKPPRAPSPPSSEPVNTVEATEVSPATEETTNQTVRDSPSDHSRPRRPDLTDFTRSIDVSCLAHGIVLTNTHAQGKSRPRDIVDDRTIRLVHNAFSYKSMDSLLDFPPNTVTLEEVLNNNHLDASIDEFVCRPTHEVVDLFTEDLPGLSHQGGSLEQTILDTIRESQDLSQPEGSCDICIITIDHDNLSVIPEVESMESVGHQQPGTDELRINDVLPFFTEVLRNLDIRDMDLNSVRFEILQDLLNEEDVSARNNVVEMIDVENEEECSKDEEELLRFIKEDICTNIEFPIVIEMADLIPNFLNGLDDVDRKLDQTVGYERQIPSRLLALVEKTEENVEKNNETIEDVFQRKYIEEDEKVNNFQDVEQSEHTVAPEFPFEVSSSCKDILIGEELPAYLELVSELLKDALVDTSNGWETSSTSESLEFFSPDTSKLEDSFGKKSSMIKPLNKTSEIRKSNFLVGQMFEEGSTKNESDKSEEIERVEDIEANRITEFTEIEDTTKSIKPDEIIDSIETEEIHVNTKFSESTYKKEEELKTFELDTEENGGTIEEISTDEYYVDIKTDQENSEVVSLEPVSLKVVFVFWFIVFLFYIRYFYQEISSSAPTPKPFEIHAVSTSTSRLLEKTKFTERINEESLSDVNEDLERSTDLENAEDSCSREYLQKIQGSIDDGTFSRDIEIKTRDDMEEINTEVEKTILDLSKRVSEDAEALSLLKFNEKSITKCSFSDLSDTESQREEKTRSGSPVTRDPWLPLPVDHTTKPEEIVTNRRSSIFESKKGKFLGVYTIEKDITCFRFKEVDDSSSSGSLLKEDHQASCEAQLNIIVKEEIQEEGPESEVRGKIDSKVESSFLTSQNSEKKEEYSSCAEESKSEEAPTPEEGASTEQEVVENSTEHTFLSVLETTLDEVDSFNSEYSAHSETSKDTASLDLLKSWMEEFSNESNEIT